jgi:hypothetical protein
MSETVQPQPDRDTVSSRVSFCKACSSTRHSSPRRRSRPPAAARQGPRSGPDRAGRPQHGHHNRRPAHRTRQFAGWRGPGGARVVRLQVTKTGYRCRPKVRRSESPRVEHAGSTRRHHELPTSTPDVPFTAGRASSFVVLNRSSRLLTQESAQTTAELDGKRCARARNPYMMTRSRAASPGHTA